jgi:alpha-mannosidase
VAEVLTSDVRVRAGEAGEVRVALRNQALSEIRGEAQILSPHETWPAISPWTQGFAVGPGEEQIVTFAVEPPYASGGGTYWALVKIMYFGRLLYTESIPVDILASDAARGGRSERASAAASGAG